MSIPAFVVPASEAERGPSEPGPTPLALAIVETSLATASIDELEAAALAVTGPWRDATFERVAGTVEAGLLTTCHRVELLLLTDDPRAPDGWLRLLPGRPESWRTWSDREAARHLFRVAGGLESLAVGEVEVRRQVADARRTIRSRHPRSLLRGLLGESLAAASASLDAGIRRPSVASVAAEHLLRKVGLEKPRVLVLGSGTVGRAVAHALAGRARVTLAYHRNEPGAAWLQEVEATAVPLDGLTELLAASDAVVAAAKVGRRAIGLSDLPATGGPRLWIDLGVPRNIDPAVRSRSGVTLVDVGELFAARSAEASSAGHADRARSDASADAWSEGFDRERVETWIGSLRRAADEMRRAELATALPYLGPLSAGQKAAVERLSRRLLARLLDPVSLRLRELPGGEDGERVRRLAFDLLAPDVPEP